MQTINIIKKKEASMIQIMHFNFRAQRLHCLVLCQYTLTLHMVNVLLWIPITNFFICRAIVDRHNLDRNKNVRPYCLLCSYDGCFYDKCF